MKRSLRSEIIDDPALSDEVMDLVYADLARTHTALGNTRTLVSALRKGDRPSRRVLDIGCGRGQLLTELRRRLGVEVIGVELRRPAAPIAGIPIFRADAVRDPLPRCDTAIAVCVAHHLSDDELVALIRNVGRFCDRFVILDLVRHSLPLALFRLFVAPFVHPVNAVDGAQSIQRAFTPTEMYTLVHRAVHASGASFRHYVNPFRIRQLVDITYWVFALGGTHLRGLLRPAFSSCDGASALLKPTLPTRGAAMVALEGPGELPRVTPLVSPQAANIERAGFAVLGVVIKAIDDAGAGVGANGLNVTPDAQLVV